MSRPTAAQAPSHAEQRAVNQPVGYWKLERQGWVFYHQATNEAYWRELPTAPNFDILQSAEEYGYAQEIEVTEDGQAIN